MKKLLIPIVIIILVALGLFFWKSAPAPEINTTSNDAADNIANISAALESLNVDEPDADIDSLDADVKSL